MLAQPLLSSLFPEIIFRLNGEANALYLTFDDGPTEITHWVLDELKKYNAQATFFCVGSNVEKNIPLYHKIIEHGHSAGNHTMHHLNGWKVSTKQYLGDVNTCDKLLNSLKPQTANADASGQHRDIHRPDHKPQTFFRPPYGRMTPSQYFSLKKNYRLVMWDVLSKDYDENVTAEECLQRVITKSKPGSVVVFHDSIKAEKNLRYTLPKVLEYFSERNFSFREIELH